MGDNHQDGGRGDNHQDGGNRGKHHQDGGHVGKHHQDGGRGKHHQDGDRGKHHQDGGRGKHHQDGDRGKHHQDGGRGKHHQDGDRGKHHQDGGRGKHHQDSTVRYKYGKYEVKKTTKSEEAVLNAKICPPKTRNARKQVKRRRNRAKNFHKNLFAAEYSPDVEEKLKFRIKSLDKRVKAHYRRGLALARHAAVVEKERKIMGKPEADCNERLESRKFFRKAQDTTAEVIRAREHLKSYQKGERGLRFPESPNPQIIDDYIHKMMGFK